MPLDLPCPALPTVHPPESRGCPSFQGPQFAADGLLWLRASGWTVCAPGEVPAPRNRQEAEHMGAVSKRYLEDHPA